MDSRKSSHTDVGTVEKHPELVVPRSTSVSSIANTTNTANSVGDGFQKTHDSEKSAHGVEAAVEEANEAAPAAPSVDANKETWRQVTILVGLLLASVIISLDSTIVVTANPAITKLFNSIGDVGWYGSAYFLGLVLAQPVLGNLFFQLNPKYVLWASLLIFVVGSIVAATAQHSYVLIIGRAIAGAGGSGLFTGALVIANFIAPDNKKTVYVGLICCVFGVGSAAGPLIGGAFTDSSVTWRFCFWVNLPIAAVTLFCTIFYQTPNFKDPPSVLGVVKKLDILGLIPLTISLVCLLLALNWSSATDSASHRREIGFFVGFAVAFVIFLAKQKFLPLNTDQILSFRILKIRTIWACALSELLFIMASRVQIYYLPIYFQVVKSASPVMSGVELVPYLGAMAVAPIIAGVITAKQPYPQPVIWAGLAIFVVGSGLMYAIQVNTSLGFNIGAQIVAGFGIGLAIQTVITTMQGSVSMQDIPLVTALHVFCINFGPTVSIAAAQNIFIKQIAAKLTDYGIDPAPFVREAALATSEVLNVSAAQASAVVNAYSFALTKVFLFALAANGAAFVVSLAMPLKRMGPPGS